MYIYVDMYRDEKNITRALQRTTLVIKLFANVKGSGFYTFFRVSKWLTEVKKVRKF